MRKRTKYTSEGRAMFFRALEAYETALRNGRDIVQASLFVHSAKGLVSPAMRSMVTKTFKRVTAERAMIQPVS